jgi:hypothetical protein
LDNTSDSSVTIRTVAALDILSCQVSRKTKDFR